MIRDRITGYSKSYGFVNFKNSSDAATAVMHMHGYELFGKMLIVRVAGPVAGASPPGLLQNYPWPAAVYTDPNQTAWWYPSPTWLSETQAYYSNFGGLGVSPSLLYTGHWELPPDNGTTGQPSYDIPSCADSKSESNWTAKCITAPWGKKGIHLFTKNNNNKK